MLAQITAVIIFLIMFGFIITEKIERHYATLGYGLPTLLLVFGVCMRDLGAILETLNIGPIFSLHSMGTDIGGSATPIGASANVVGTSVAAKEGHSINWSRYCKAMVPATLIVLAISTACIWLRYL